MKEGITRINVQMPDSLLEEIKESADKAQRSVSAEVVYRLTTKPKSILKVRKSRKDMLKAITYYADNSEGLDAVIETDDDLAEWTRHVIIEATGADENEPISISVTSESVVVQADSSIIQDLNMYLF